MFINGKEMDFNEEITIKKLLDKLNLYNKKIVIEVNLEIIPQNNYSNHFLHKGDKIEIISLIGGG